MSDLEITPQGVTRRVKSETQVRILSYLAIPIKRKTTHKGGFLFISKYANENSRSEFDKFVPWTKWTMNKFEILAQAKTRRAKVETKWNFCLISHQLIIARLFQHLAIPTSRLPTVFPDSGNGPHDRRAKPKLHLQTDMIRTYRQQRTGQHNS